MAKCGRVGPTKTAATSGAGSLDKRSGRRATMATGNPRTSRPGSTEAKRCPAMAANSGRAGPTSGGDISGDGGNEYNL